MKIKHHSLMEVEKNEEDLKALLFLTLGTKYLNLVNNVLSESINSGNPHVIVSDSESFLDDYFNKTKWSDFRIIEPVLFNFYHGLELTLKGLLLLIKKGVIQPSHNITDHFEELNNLSDIPIRLKEVIREHIIIDKNTNPLIFEFLNKNNLNIDQLYESLRYPSDKSFKNNKTYINLHYKEADSLKYFEKVMTDINTIQRFGNMLYSDLTRTGMGFIKME